MPKAKPAVRSDGVAFFPAWWPTREPVRHIVAELRADRAGRAPLSIKFRRDPVPALRYGLFARGQAGSALDSATRHERLFGLIESGR